MLHALSDWLLKDRARSFLVRDGQRGRRERRQLEGEETREGKRGGGRGGEGERDRESRTEGRVEREGDRV